MLTCPTPRGTVQIEFDEFVGIMASRMLRTDSAEEMDHAFKYPYA